MTTTRYYEMQREPGLYLVTVTINDAIIDCYGTTTKIEIKQHRQFVMVHDPEEFRKYLKTLCAVQGAVVSASKLEEEDKILEL